MLDDTYKYTKYNGTLLKIPQILFLYFKFIVIPFFRYKNVGIFVEHYKDSVDLKMVILEKPKILKALLH